MKAIEFDAQIKDGKIEVPPEYIAELEGKLLRVIILIKEKTDLKAEIKD